MHYDTPLIPRDAVLGDPERVAPALLPDGQRIACVVSWRRSWSGWGEWRCEPIVEAVKREG